MLGCINIDSPMDVNTKLLPYQGNILEDAERYRRLMRKLNYLTMIKPDIKFTVSAVSQFLSPPRATHLEAVMRILRYLKKAPRRRLFYSNCGHIRAACLSDAD